jgi:hypothetical protein
MPKRNRPAGRFFYCPSHPETNGDGISGRKKTGPKAGFSEVMQITSKQPEQQQPKRRQQQPKQPKQQPKQPKRQRQQQPERPGR